jgi:hypothetical protein
MRMHMMLILLLVLCSQFQPSFQSSVWFRTSEDVQIVSNVTLASEDYDSVKVDVVSDFSLYGNLSVTSPVGGFVTLKIMDQANYDYYTQGGGGLSFVLVNQKSYDDFTFSTEASGPWYFVVENEEMTQVNATLIYALDQTGPMIDVDIEEGKTYSGVTTITATAQDNRPGFVDVGIWIDTVEKARTSLGFAFYEWDTKEYADGSYNITVAAADMVGNSELVVLEVLVSNSPTWLYPLIVIVGAVVAFLIILLLRRK